MNLFRINIPLASLPIVLVCFSNGQVGFAPIKESFNTIIDQFKGGVDGIISKEGVKLGSESYNFFSAYDYKSIPNLLAWLKQQQLILPEFANG